MTKILKEILILYLTLFARIHLKKINPKVIAFTGSIGKTTFKQILGEIFSTTYKTKYPKKSLNSEWGIPLFILDIKLDTTSIFSILNLIWKPIITILVNHDKYDYLLIEKGIDRPGEMKYLKMLTSLDAGILLNVSATHTQNFAGEDPEQGVFLEKAKILDFADLKFINLDSNRIYQNYEKGYFEKFEHLTTISKKHLASFKYEVRQTDTGFLQIHAYHKDFNIVRPFPIEFAESFAMAIAVSKMFNIPDEIIQNGLNSFRDEPGRFTFLAGINNSKILDSSYNSSYLATKSVLEFVRKYSAKRKILCLGDMRELGKLTEKEHKALIPMINEIGNEAFFVGTNMEKYVFPEITINKKMFRNTVELGNFLKDFIREGDLVVFKGSQNTIFLEEAIKPILANISDRGLLCRQETDWLKRKEKFFKAQK